MKICDLKQRISSIMVPLPVFFNKDHSIDHTALEKYISWLIENRMTNFCTTFVYDVLDSITHAEMLDLTTTISRTLKNNCLYLSCTSGGPISTVIDITNKMGKNGASGVFIHPPLFVMQGGGGDLYFNYLSEILENTDMPLFSVALPDPWKSLNTPMLNIEHYESLAKYKNYMGFKDDFYHIPTRKLLAERFGDRLWIIGGGDFKKYIVNSHYPGQSEFAGNICPARHKRIFALLNENRYLEAIKMYDEQAGARPKYVSSDLHWIAARSVIFWAMGFSDSYETRPPIKSATKSQAQEILNKMYENRDLYERPLRQSMEGNDL